MAVRVRAAAGCPCSAAWLAARTISCGRPRAPSSALGRRLAQRGLATTALSTFRWCRRTIAGFGSSWSSANRRLHRLHRPTANDSSRPLHGSSIRRRYRASSASITFLSRRAASCARSWWNTDVADLGPSVVTPAPRDVWNDVLAADRCALVSQTPAWVDSLCANNAYSDASRLYLWPNGRQLVLPMVRGKRWPAGASSEASYPDGWGIGGLIGAGEITPVEVGSVLADL